MFPVKNALSFDTFAVLARILYEIEFKEEKGNGPIPTRLAVVTSPFLEFSLDCDTTDILHKEKAKVACCVTLFLRPL